MKASHPLAPLLALLFLAFIAPAPAAEDNAIRVLKDIPYKSGDTLDPYEAERGKLDLYLPKNASASTPELPCIVWFHGGGITEGDKSRTASTCRALAAEGIIVATANYRLSPQAKFPAYIHDSAAAVAWMLKNAAQHGGSPQRVFVSGHSAGAYLAAMVAVDPKYLTAQGASLQQLAGSIPVAGQMATHFTIRQERGLPKTQIIIDEAAPLYFTIGNRVPTLLLYAEKDMELRGEENRYFAAALGFAGNKNVTVKEMPGHNHGSIAGRISEPDSIVRKEIMGFIRQFSQPPPPKQ